MTLTFIYLSDFVKDCNRLKLSEGDLRALESGLLADPDIGKIVRNTGGVRKMRFAPPSWHQGKSGAIRVLYAHFAAHQHLYLILCYGKGEQENLTPRQSEACRYLMQQIEVYLEQLARRTR